MEDEGQRTKEMGRPTRLLESSNPDISGNTNLSQYCHNLEGDLRFSNVLLHTEKFDQCVRAVCSIEEDATGEL